MAPPLQSQFRRPVFIKYFLFMTISHWIELLINLLVAFPVAVLSIYLIVVKSCVSIIFVLLCFFIFFICFYCRALDYNMSILLSLL